MQVLAVCVDARRAGPLRLCRKLMSRGVSLRARGCNCTSSDCTSSELSSVVSDVELTRDGTSTIAGSVGFGLPDTDENSPGTPDFIVGRHGQGPMSRPILK